MRTAGPDCGSPVDGCGARPCPTHDLRRCCRAGETRSSPSCGKKTERVLGAVTPGDPRRCGTCGSTTRSAWSPAATSSRSPGSSDGDRVEVVMRSKDNGGRLLTWVGLRPSYARRTSVGAGRRSPGRGAAEPRRPRHRRRRLGERQHGPPDRADGEVVRRRGPVDERPPRRRGPTAATTRGPLPRILHRRVSAAEALLTRMRLPASRAGRRSPRWPPAAPGRRRGTASRPRRPPRPGRTAPTGRPISTPCLIVVATALGQQPGGHQRHPEAGRGGAGRRVLGHAEPRDEDPGVHLRGAARRRSTAYDVEPVERVLARPAVGDPLGDRPERPARRYGRTTASSVTGRCTNVSPQPATHASPARSSARAARQRASRPRARSGSQRPGEVARRRGELDRRVRRREPHPDPAGAAHLLPSSPVSRPGSRSTHAVPSVGWPANGISLPGVKIRVAYSRPSSTSRRGNVVSEKPNSRAMRQALLGGQLVGAVHHGQLVAGERAGR